ncbi:ATP-grasp domain-containing protein [Micromonospora sp. WMMD998]|uniref:ATP-grasp domain-containing protein n=1 Tax=Micromonospora sp. WMMD998 TaxID=3016092 RepID=UPI00249C1D0D|nr:ATP-grasp domain-containing protein [Micromonospora sp. WMMD998]WFE41144.1 ATP-grasp domain-containing protein [Micromonospora sp. WMMD998]
MAKPRLLVLTPGIRAYREYLLRSIGLAYRVHLILTESPTWERTYLDGWTVVADLADTDDLVRVTTGLAGETRFDGVLCWDETWIVQAARVAAALGLPGDPTVIERCRDKHHTRAALDANHVAQPGSRLVGDEGTALSAAQEIGFPVVLKPRAMAGSFGVVKAADEAEVRRFVAFTNQSWRMAPELPRHVRNILVEEYAEGPEISVDSVVFQGEVTPVCIARKELGFAPYFEEMGHVVDPGDPLWHEPTLTSLVEDAHAALGFTDGVTHTEIRLTRQGPKIIEVNARIGGGLIPYLNVLGGGADLGLAAAAVACGRRPTVDVALRRRPTAIRFYHPAHDNSVIDEITFDPAGLPPQVVEHGPLAEPGEVKSPPPRMLMDGRVAYAIAVGERADDCRAALDAAGRALRISIR